jgi:hypothetical protein
MESNGPPVRDLELVADADFEIALGPREDAVGVAERFLVVRLSMVPDMLSCLPTT